MCPAEPDGFQSLASGEYKNAGLWPNESGLDGPRG